MVCRGPIFIVEQEQVASGFTFPRPDQIGTLGRKFDGPD
jgi:hypothetical protein